LNNLAHSTSTNIRRTRKARWGETPKRGWTNESNI
jgi:hypothetical protein